MTQSLAPEKGNLPEMNWKRTQPTAHRSLSLHAYLSSPSSSGETYCAVPARAGEGLDGNVLRRTYQGGGRVRRNSKSSLNGTLHFLTC